MTDFSIKKIGLNDLESLNQFIQTLGESSSTFRYFESRPLNVIKNHLLTILVLNERNEGVGYGHLDQENGEIWLGIAVIDKLKGKGIGTLIMKYILEFSDEFGVEELKLAVDKINVAAVRLYTKNGFKVLKMLEKSVLMVRYGM